MYVVVLILLIGFKIYKTIQKRKVTTRAIISCILPSLRTGTKDDQEIGLLQMLVVSCISLVEAIKSESLIEAIIVFSIIFCLYTMLIILLVSFVMWLQEYMKLITINTLFSIVVPIILLLNMSKMHILLEKRIAVVSLSMSLIVVYRELIRIVTESNVTMENKEKAYPMGKALKIKSIITWFIIIMINLYTVLVFVQFYWGKGGHFIEAISLNKESAVDLLYYLVVTFTTVGFGDIWPRTMMAKLVTVMISLSGMLFSGMFIGVILTYDEQKDLSN